jgi:hypothetical protein
MVCEYTGAWKHLYDWQSLIAGSLAFIAGLVAFFAGLIQAKATRRAAETQVESAERTKRLQAKGIAVAVDLGLSTLETDIQRARDNLIRLKTDVSDNAGQTIMARVQEIAKIQPPPILERNVDKLYMLGEPAGPLCLRLIHMLFEQDMQTVASVSSMGPMSRYEWPPVVDELERSLAGLSDKVAECERAVQPILRL